MKRNGMDLTDADRKYKAWFDSLTPEDQRMELRAVAAFDPSDEPPAACNHRDGFGSTIIVGPGPIGAEGPAVCLLCDARAPFLTVIRHETQS